MKERNKKMSVIEKAVSGSVSMKYFKFGNGDKVMVLIPGLSIKSVMESADAVEEAFGQYKDGYTIYVFDRREELPEIYSIQDMAADTAAVMKELGLSKISLFGASQGGMIAMVIAMEYPELVDKLVLGSTSSHVKPEQQGVIDKWLTLAQNKDVSELCKSYAQEIYPAAVYEANKAFFDDMAKSVTQEELDRFVILAKSIKEFDVTSSLKKIKCPVLAIGAFEDAVLDDDATLEIAENLDYRSDFKLYMYTGYGHAAFDTAPDYRQRVFDFLNGVKRDGSF